MNEIAVKWFTRSRQIYIRGSEGFPTALFCTYLHLQKKMRFIKGQTMSLLVFRFLKEDFDLVMFNEHLYLIIRATHAGRLITFCLAVLGIR